MAHDLKELLEKIDDLGTCMLTTRDGDIFRSRPMHPIVEKTVGEIRFLVEGDGATDVEIDRNPACNLSFIDRNRHEYLSVSGVGITTRDKEEIKRSWTEGADVYFPDGPEKTDVVLIRVHPTHAEFWEADSNIITRTWSFLKAKLKGEQPQLGDSEKMKFVEEIPAVKSEQVGGSQ